jgi:DNA polymerase (family 10)
VDIRAVIHKQYVPALAYFTGSGEENVRLRGIALKKKMKLNEYGIKNMQTEKFFELITEEDLYDVLGEEYVVPVER